MNTKLRLTTAWLALLATGACEDDPTRPRAEPREYGVVVNSVSASVTIFPVGDPDSTYTVALDPAATATTIAIRDGIALVPLGLFPAVAVIDLAAGEVIDEIPLPAGSGATGVAIVNDTLAFVANPMLNSVTPVYYRRGDTGEDIPVGVYPTALLAVGNRVFVVEANLVSFTPAGPSTMSVIDATTLEVVNDIELSGKNAADAAVSVDALFVVHAGNFDSANSSLSVVHLPTEEELDHHTSFGAFASEVEGTLDLRAVIGSPAYGVALFDQMDEAFEVGPGEGFGASGRNVLGIGLDANQRLWVLDAADCASPGHALLVSGPAGVVVDEAEVEVCPDAIAFGTF